MQVGESNNNEAIINLGLNQDDRIYLSIPSGMEEDEISLLAELDGKRSNKEEELQDSKPKTRTITLPDGSTREVTEEQMQKMKQRRGGSGGGRGN